MNINSFIQYNIVEPTITLQEVLDLCTQAEKMKIKAVCVPPIFVENIYEKFKSTELIISTVISFPYGAAPASSKVEEIVKAINSGTNEIDVVVNHNALKSGMWDKVNHELDRITTMSNIRNRDLKLIVETSLLTDEELTKICELAVDNGVQYIQTSTIYNKKIKTDKLELLNKLLPNSVKIAAAGIISSPEEAKNIINMGVARIITSSESKI